MVVANMDGPTRDQILRFIKNKERIEQEIQELTAVLDSQHVGMHEPLVDEDGFPRADIDVYKVRNARHRIICLQNDHKSIMRHIEKGLHLLHSKVRPGEPSTSGNTERMDTEQSGNTEDKMADIVSGATRMKLAEQRPIARVNFVSEGSPAENAGIRVEDEILEFGSVNSSNFKSLNQIGEIVSHSVGSQVNVKLKRGEENINATLIPNKWSGRGLLGCNIVPV